MHFSIVATPGVRKCGVGGEVGEGSLVPTLNFCMINGAPEISWIPLPQLSTVARMGCTFLLSQLIKRFFLYFPWLQTWKNTNRNARNWQQGITAIVALHLTTQFDKNRTQSLAKEISTNGRKQSLSINIHLATISGFFYVQQDRWRAYSIFNQTNTKQLCSL